MVVLIELKTFLIVCGHFLLCRVAAQLDSNASPKLQSVDQNSLAASLSGNASSLLASAASTEKFNVCETARQKCNNDTDCFHRLLYVHATCVTGRCVIQCKTAVLRLFQSRHGKDLLESDMSCVSAVRGEIEQCRLDPKADHIHCTLAQTQCEDQPTCKRLLDAFETKCESKLASGCPRECALQLGELFLNREGAKFKDCMCWKQDPLCFHTKTMLIDPCKSELESPTFNAPSTANVNNNNNNIDNSLMPDKPQDNNSVGTIPVDNNSIPDPPVMSQNNIGNTIIVGGNHANGAESILARRQSFVLCGLAVLLVVILLD